MDPPLLRLASDLLRPGHIVWDIGANVGLFTFAAATLAGPRGRVLAVEPDTELVRLLRRSAACNTNQAKVEIIPVAVADKVTVSNFHIACRNRATSHLEGFGTTQTGGVRSTQLVPTVSLDWLAAHFPLPDVIKIDVETAETKVLAGAADILGEGPTLICEVAACNATAVAEMLTSHGYTLYDGDLPAAQRRSVTYAPPTTLAVKDTPSSLVR